MQYIKYSVRQLATMDYVGKKDNYITVRELVDIYYNMANRENFFLICDVVNANASIHIYNSKINIEIFDNKSNISNMIITRNEDGLSYKLNSEDKLLTWAISDNEDALLNKMYLDIDDLPEIIKGNLSCNCNKEKDNNELKRKIDFFKKRSLERKRIK